MSAATAPVGDTASVAPYQRHVARLETIPEALRDLQIWCAWRLIQKPGEKPGKKPVSPKAGNTFGWTLPGFCVTAAEAIRYADSHPDVQGIGLVVGNGLSGGDLDHCVVDGQPSPLAQSIISEANTYTEVSPGLNGYRFLFLGSFGGYTGNNREQGVEFYDEKRFLTFTGLHLPWTPTGVERRDLSALGSKWFRQDATGGGDTDAPKDHIHVELGSLSVSDKVMDLILNGAPQGERSEAMFSVALALIRTGVDDVTACHILTDPAYRISAKAFDERGSHRSAMRWVMKYVVAKARKEINMDIEEAIKGLNNIPPGASGAGASAAAPDELWPWETPVDIFDERVIVPPYTPGLLPPVYEAMIEANYRFHSLATRELYAGMFMLSVACHLRPSVRVEEKAGSGINGGHMFSINEQAGAVGPSTHGKTGTMMHVVGNDRGDATSVMAAWDKKERLAANAKFKVQADRIRESSKLNETEIKAKLAELKLEMPIPDIINAKITDKAIIQTSAANERMDLPMNIIIDEWEHVYGSASYRGDGGNSISDLHKKMADNHPFSDKTSGSGKVASDRLSGNIGFTSTPSDMAAWKGYQQALRSGDMARKSLFAPGATWRGERDKTIDKAPIAAWRAVQEKLHDLANISLYFEEDAEFETITDAEIDKFSQQADNGDHVATWLAKSKVRSARLAACMYIVDQIAAGHAPGGAVTIPKAYRRRAWRFLTLFAWPHQVFVHNRLIAGEEFKTALQILLRRVVVNRKEVLKNDEIIGGGASPALRRGGDDLVKALLNTYHWLRPKITRKGFNHQRPWEAGQFEVNPRIFDVYQKYEARLKEEHEVARGQIRDVFGGA